MPSPADPPVIVFAGPSLAPSASAQGLRRIAPGVRWRPPVKRFDVEKIVGRRAPPGVLVIIDGVFHDTLAVGHAEIREALRSGWRVWGVSSMGAIRAREMGPLGMRGYGRVFELFVSCSDFQDDEVALLHEPGPPYRAVSEPLVHLREAIRRLVTVGLVREDDGREVVADLKSRWFGDRTLRATTDALLKKTRSARRREAIRAELSDFQRFAIKNADAKQFLERRVWLLP
jgi:hypothetical protein